MERMRLNKYLAHCGVCSRREADRLIEEGRVEVNGTTAQMGCAVSGSDVVSLEGRRIQAGDRKVVLAFYKPVGVTCTERDSHAEKTIFDLLKYPSRVTYAGRLDKDSEGLLLLGNDGDLIQAMMKGSGSHEKEYVVKINREVTEEFLEKMRRGVYLEELGVTTKKCRAERTGMFTFRLVLTQGVNRQIKRMCLACGCRVRELKRVRVMHIELGDLRPGEYRELDREDVRRLYRECGIPTK